LPVIDSALSSASFERAMRSGPMSAPSRAPSGTASARSPVPSASVSLGLQPRRALDVAAGVRRVARTEQVVVAAAGLLRGAVAAEDAAVGHGVGLRLGTPLGSSPTGALSVGDHPEADEA
jgi:hypothetical protein